MIDAERHGPGQTLTALLRWYAAMGVDCARGRDAGRSLRSIALRRRPRRNPRKPVAARIRRGAVRLASAPRARRPSDRACADSVRAQAAAARPPPRLAACGRRCRRIPPPPARANRRRARARSTNCAKNSRAFDGCALKNSATQLVFADGAPDARIMIVGEGPGADEDRIGRPFVGRAGQLLDKMLAAIGLDRTKVYIANVVPWRPPGNRTPTPQELALCLPFIRRQIELVSPDFLVLLGASAAQTLLEREGRHHAAARPLARLSTAATRSIRALPMLHPAYLLRAPLKKAQAWRDLRALKHALDKQGFDLMAAHFELEAELIAAGALAGRRNRRGRARAARRAGLRRGGHSRRRPILPQGLDDSKKLTARAARGALRRNSARARSPCR